MKKLLATGVAVLLAAGATAVQAHDPAAQRAERLGKRLDLTEEQQAQVNAIYAEAREQRATLREQEREQRKARREQSRAIGETTQERLSAVLTEEQNTRLAEMRENRKDRRAIMHRSKRRGHYQPGMEREWSRERLRRMLRHRRSQ